MRTAERPLAINPYMGRVKDHPGCLLPDPSPEGLRRLRERAGRAPRRVLVDLGCGAGQFLARIAMAHPQDDCIGFELRYKRLVKSARKLERAGVANAWLVRDEAGSFADYFDPASIDAVFVNFPDPWPRASQWKKRLLNHGFMDALERVLRPQGRLCLKTDHAGYFLHSLALIRARPGWQVTDFSNDLHRRARLLAGCPEATVETEFEQLFRSQCKAVFAVAIVRRNP
jgi:tRNA (guanine-N7-)-methyltransferase